MSCYAMRVNAFMARTIVDRGKKTGVINISQQQLDSMVGLADRSLNKLLFDFSRATQDVVKADKNVRTVVVDAHEYSESVIDVFTQTLAKTQGDWDLQGLMPTLKQEAVVLLMQEQVFVEEDREKITGLLETVKVGDKTVFDALFDWLEKHSSLEEKKEKKATTAFDVSAPAQILQALKGEGSNEN